jgi:hypothetical protein
MTGEQGGASAPPTDKLTEALNYYRDGLPDDATDLDRHHFAALFEAAKHQASFPTDDDVLRVAKAQYEAQMPDFSWEKAHSLNATGQYLALARVGLEAALEAVKREDR